MQQCECGPCSDIDNIVQSHLIPTHTCMATMQIYKNKPWVEYTYKQAQHLLVTEPLLTFDYITFFLSSR